jgi:hypothetical protein
MLFLKLCRSVDAYCYTDILTDISDSGFSQHFTPCCCNQTILQKGMLGKIDGLKVYTDSFSAVQFLPKQTVFLAKESDIIRWLENCKMDMDCKPIFDKEYGSLPTTSDRGV